MSRFITVHPVWAEIRRPVNLLHWQQNMYLISSPVRNCASGSMPVLRVNVSRAFNPFGFDFTQLAAIAVIPAQAGIHVGAESYV